VYIYIQSEHTQYIDWYLYTCIFVCVYMSIQSEHTQYIDWYLYTCMYVYTCLYSLSIHSTLTDIDTTTTDLADLSPSRVSPSFLRASAAAGVTGVSGSVGTTYVKDTYSVWRAHVNRIIADEGYRSHAHNTFHLFVRLFNVRGCSTALNSILDHSLLIIQIH